MRSDNTEAQTESLTRVSGEKREKRGKCGKSRVRLLLSLLMATALLAIVLWFADLDELGRRVRGVNLGLLGLSMVAYFVTYVARAGRFAAAGAKASIATLFLVVSVHGALNRVMPLRTGELSYPLIAQRIGAAGLGEGLVQLLMLRILDLLTIASIFVLALGVSTALGVAGFTTNAGSAAMMTGILGFVSALALWRLGWFLRTSLGLTSWVLGRTGLAKEGGKVATILERADGAVRSVTDLTLTKRLELGFWSLLCWGSYFALFHLILLALGVEIHLLQTILGSSAAIVGSVIPVSGLGTFGALEGGWTAGFAAIGMDPATAASTALLMSGLTLSFALFLGFIGWIALGLRRSPDTADSSRSTFVD